MTHSDPKCLKTGHSTPYSKEQAMKCVYICKCISIDWF